MGKPSVQLTATIVVVGAALFCGTACGSSGSDPAPSAASPAASAEPTSSAPAAAGFNGIYQIAYEDGTVETWSAVSCGPGCADVQEQQFGVVPVSFTGKARAEEGTWKMVVQRSDAIVCDDGSEFEGTSTWTWDSSTLEGSLTATQMVAACDKPVGFETDELGFTMTKTSSGGPAPGFQSS
jgi:hypothetical protein